MRRAATRVAPDSGLSFDDVQESPAVRVYEQDTQIWRSAITFAGFVLVLCPLTVITVGSFFGWILALVEGWHFWDGFYYVVSNLTGLATPLTELSPESNLGKFFDVLVAVWSLSLAGCIIGVVGSLPVVTNIVRKAEAWERGKLAKGHLKEAFKTDEDGVLTLEEFVAVVVKSHPSLTLDMCKTMFDMLDEDKSGTLSEKEAERISKVISLFPVAATPNTPSSPQVPQSLDQTRRGSADDQVLAELAALRRDVTRMLSVRVHGNQCMIPACT